MAFINPVGKFYQYKSLQLRVNSNGVCVLTGSKPEKVHNLNLN